jgi:formate hydrogenlyase subunit 3/multisubunit Na+/H+ antiporter MnhD subunit
MLAGGLWAFSLSVLRKEVPTTGFENVRGIFYRMPYASAALALSSLTLAGLPLLSMFPIRIVLMEEVARVSLVSALGALAGMVGMLFSTVRVLVVLTGSRTRQPSAETRLQTAMLVGGIGALVLVGLFPQLFYPLVFGLSGGSAPAP